MTALQTVLWDVDGTIAETERDGHRVAFNRAFTEYGLTWQWDVATYGKLLEVSGGFERILFDMETRTGAPSNPGEREALARQLHASKGRHYADLVAADSLPARPGVIRLVQECIGDGLRLGIATTTGRANVDALFPHLFGRDWEALFRVVVCAEDAPDKKPDPSVYLEALRRLGLSASEAIAIEDSPNGLLAAQRAGIPTLVTPGAYFQDVSFPGAALVVSSLEASVSFKGQTYLRTTPPLLRELQRSFEEDSGSRGN